MMAAKKMPTANDRRRALELLRQGVPPARNKARPKKTPEPPSQKPLERDYRRRIFTLIDPAFEIVRELVFGDLSDLVAAGKQEGLRVDATGDDISRLFGSVRVQFASLFDDRRIDRNIDEVSRRVSRTNQATLRRQFQTVIGIDPTQAEPWLEPLLELHASENASLIKTLPGEALPDIEQIVIRGVRSGESATSIQNQILERWSITQGRARTIARDQVSKLGASLNSQRQQRAGVTEYKWKDVDDAKVRKTHEQRDGEIFEWARPIQPQLAEKGLKVDQIDGHPGQPINCRCQPIPQFG